MLHSIYLLYWHLSAARLELEMEQAHFTCFTSTQVRILTQKLEQAPHLEKKWKGMLKKQKKVYILYYIDIIQCVCVCVRVCV